ncbi:copper resistance protein NlpE [Zophobihabitans entericus]|uniref:Copper resistance protein NlpE n=1 Tax=Zophobihabitans entericus TaxID=1635327 RepID=A0A6G9IA03_9GAMM|nr:copper resistance protein NlpE N-terminal domain-containing protein [Zophobihabitans entericus]QIQ21051.1 copper resistance protein NlpE [Zophobihabitans entericus]
MKKYLVLLFASFMLMACDNQSNSTSAGQPLPETPVETTDMHNSMNSLDYVGVYTGVLPLDNELTEITVQLYDTNYVFAAKGNERKGSFSWNSDGNQITLYDNFGNEFVNFAVGENRLILLDYEHEPVLNSDEEEYTLLKQ